MTFDGTVTLGTILELLLLLAAGAAAYARLASQLAILKNELEHAWPAVRATDAEVKNLWHALASAGIAHRRQTAQVESKRP